MMKQEMGGQGHAGGGGEAMSRLIDGELDGSDCRALVQTLSTDELARQDWVLLNIVCDAIRSSETAALHATGFVTRVSAALASEPVILAPRALVRRQSMLRRVIVPAVAVAAAAAVVVVVAVPQLRGPTSDTQVASKGKPSEVVEVAGNGPMIRSGEFEAYLDAHRESSAGPLTSRDFVMKATMTTESR